MKCAYIDRAILVSLPSSYYFPVLCKIDTHVSIMDCESDIQETKKVTHKLTNKVSILFTRIFPEVALDITHMILKSPWLLMSQTDIQSMHDPSLSRLEYTDCLIRYIQMFYYEWSCFNIQVICYFKCNLTKKKTTTICCAIKCVIPGGVNRVHRKHLFCTDILTPGYSNRWRLRHWWFLN